MVHVTKDGISVFNLYFCEINYIQANFYSFAANSVIKQELITSIHVTELHRLQLLTSLDMVH